MPNCDLRSCACQGFQIGDKVKVFGTFQGKELSLYGTVAKILHGEYFNTAVLDLVDCYSSDGCKLSPVSLSPEMVSLVSRP